MNIFITGIAGVLGSVLKDRLRRQGHAVYGCDLTHSDDPQIIRADIAERRQLSRAFKVFDTNYDLVFHFAAEFGRKNGQDYYEDLWRTNCIGTRNVIEECLQRRTQMIFSSSSEAYGLSELYSGGKPLTEGMLDHYPPQFHNEYALSKYTNERQILTSVRNDNLDAIILRFFNIYGPPEEYTPYRSVVCQFIYKLLAGEEIAVNRGGRRSHLWIGDWCDTVSRFADPKLLDSLHSTPTYCGAGGVGDTPVFNIGGTQFESVDVTFEHILVAMADVNPYFNFHGMHVKFTDTEFANSAVKEPCNDMAKIFLDHEPKKSLHDGLVETILWTKERYGL